MKEGRKYDRIDLAIIIFVLIALAAIIWAGLRAGSCIEAMNIYNAQGEWMCKFCDKLIDGGILRK